MRTYILAYDLGIERLQNLLIDQLMKSSISNWFHLPCLELLKGVSKQETKMVEYLIAQFAYDMKTNALNQIQGLEGWARAGGYALHRVLCLLAGGKLENPAKGSSAE